MRILIVEDEKGIREYLTSALKAECFAVDEAPDGERGSYLARTNEYDLIILDNILPKKHGNAVCKEIRAEKITTPILVLSVKQETFTKVALLNAGADDYLTKPFSLEELLARIRALLRRPATLTEEIFSVGDLVLDIQKQVVTRAGAELNLTRKEFALLDYLMRHEGSVLTRAMIMEHVWDINVDPFSNTIESHILSLRKKIDSAGREKLIHTVPGRGYKIEAGRNIFCPKNIQTKDRLKRKAQKLQKV